MGVLVDWPGEQPAPSAFIFLASGSSPPPVPRPRWPPSSRPAAAELNMLYVAMTRAKHCLALSSVQPGNSAPAAGGTGWPAGHGSRSASPGPGGAWRRSRCPLMCRKPSPSPACPRCLRRCRPPACTPPRGWAMPPWPCRAMRNRPAVAPGRCHAPAAGAGRCGRCPRWPILRAHGWPAARLARLAADLDITPAAAEQAARMAQAILAGEGAWAWDAALIQTAINEAPAPGARACALTGWCSAAPCRPMTPWRAGGCWTTKRHAAPAPAGPGGAAATLPRGRVCVDARRGGACRVLTGRWAHGDGGWRRASAASALGHTPAPGAAAVDGPALPAAPAARPGAAKAAPTVPDSRQGSLF